MSYLFQLPTKIIFGTNSINELAKEVSLFKAKKVLLVTDPGVIKAGLHEKVTSCLTGAGISFDIFDGVEPDPSIATATKAARMAQEVQAEVLVALGGGSAIDTAKSASILSKSGGNLKDYAGVNKVQEAGMPLIAIPTTAGTGSEVTVFAVMSDPDNNEKFTISSPLIAPNTTILDPVLTLTLPPSLTAFTGMDALTHAIEAYTSVVAQPATDALALKAIELIMNNLRTAVGRGDNLKARENMLQAALLAGAAFNNANLGLCHAIASPLGGYFHVPHGLANAVMLPYVMEYNMTTAAEKFADIARLIGVADQGSNVRVMARKAVEAVKELAQDIKIPAKLRDVGAKEEQLPMVAKDALKSIQLRFNARVSGERDILELLQKAF
ncbi:iron-containing alcohol dehydrogenase [Desulfotomaculum nigrificans]|uniref:iron-containing alcohol dehydrogenase n=1 Tax=Desulfotomaculum nigrificans TaxID=1565 RepID=UPI0001FAEC7C|nr:iron-containing alcohol dehydrogenase [Desulfotomaculum nigrificans]